MNSEYELLMDRFGTINKPKEGMDVDTAAKKAYADMSRRATGHTPDVQKECLNELKKSLMKCQRSKKKESLISGIEKAVKSCVMLCSAAGLKVLMAELRK